MPDTIVLYTTRGGHSKALALELGSKMGAQATEIVDLVNRKGLFGWLNAGRQAAMKAATPIADPAVDLLSIKTVVLVQPVWARAVCPPIRTWLRAHAKELSGKRLALLLSAAGSAADPVRAAFETEFAKELGALAACSVVLQKLGEGARSKAIEDFAAELKKK